MLKSRLVGGLRAPLFLLTVLAGVIVSTPAWALSYTFTELAPLDGARISYALGINNVGQVVGYSSFDPACFGCGGTTRATLWNGAAPIQLGVYGTSGYAYSINDAGQVAGYEHFSYNSYYDAILWNGEIPTQLTTLYGGTSTAYAINKSGLVAGVSQTGDTGSSGTIWNTSLGTIYLPDSTIAYGINDVGQIVGRTDSQATIWNGTTPTYLDSLGGNYGSAQAINNSGLVVGFSSTPSPGAYHATLWSGTTATDLGSLGGHSYAYDINDNGIIVGQAYTVDGVGHAVLWDGTSLTDLNSLLDADAVSAGWVLNSAQSINNQGWIAGVAVNTISNVAHGFLLTPQRQFSANANGPYTVDEGSSVTLNGTATESLDDTLIYEWDLDDDGFFETVGASPTFHGIDGPSVHTIHLRVTDAGGASDTDTTTVSVNNVAPTITNLAVGGPVACGVPNTLAVNFSDPALSNDSYNVTIDWGDGQPAETFNNVKAGNVYTHAYASAGKYRASASVSDEDGGTSTAETTMLTLNFDLVGGGVLQPINSEPSYSVFKYRSTIPIKIKPQDCDGSYKDDLQPTIALTQISSEEPITPINTLTSTSAADTNGVMRFTGSPDYQYIYNLATKPLPDPSATYEIHITIPVTDQRTTAVIGLRP